MSHVDPFAVATITREVLAVIANVSLEEISYKNIEPNAKKIVDLLKRNGGFLKLNDKSHPEKIKAELGISKKAFKKAVGSLYKKRLIRIDKKGINLK